MNAMDLYDKPGFFQSRVGVEESRIFKPSTTAAVDCKSIGKMLFVV